MDNSILKVVIFLDSFYYKIDEGSYLDLGYIEEDGKCIFVLFFEFKFDIYYDILDEYVEVICRDLNVEELDIFIFKFIFWD